MKRKLQFAAVLLVLLGATYAKDKPYDLTVNVKSIAYVDTTENSYACGSRSNPYASRECGDMRGQACHIQAVVSGSDVQYELARIAYTIGGMHYLMPTGGQLPCQVEMGQSYPARWATDDHRILVVDWADVKGKHRKLNFNVVRAESVQLK